MSYSIAKSLGCPGYFGFGSGWTAQRRLSNGVVPTTEGYCETRCNGKQRCWDLHRARTRELLGEDVARVERFKLAGATEDGIAKNLAELGTGDPYVALVIANVESGMSRCKDAEPPDRAECTTPWPLPPADWDPEPEAK